MSSRSVVVALGFTLIVATAAAPAASEPQAAALGLGFHAETDAISIRVYPRIAAFGQGIIVSGELTPARAREDVTVQGRECGIPGAFFRSLWVASPNEAGGWEAELSLNTKGTTVRAHVPVSQAKPCYLAGYSKLIRT